MELDAVSHRDGPRRRSPKKAAKVNQELESVLALDLIQPSFSPWASGLDMLRMKTVELRFSGDFVL